MTAEPPPNGSPARIAEPPNTLGDEDVDIDTSGVRGLLDDAAALASSSDPRCTRVRYSPTDVDELRY